MGTWWERNVAIFFSLTNSVFLFMLIIGLFSFVENVALETNLRLRRKMYDFVVRNDAAFGHLLWLLHRSKYHSEWSFAGRRYKDEIIRPIIDSHAAAVGDKFMLMDDNFRPHFANLLDDFLFEEGILRMECQAYSPNTNPVEHVWGNLERRVTYHPLPPTTLTYPRRIGNSSS